jgi:hypothetical protein
MISFTKSRLGLIHVPPFRPIVIPWKSAISRVSNQGHPRVSNRASAIRAIQCSRIRITPQMHIAFRRPRAGGGTTGGYSYKESRGWSALRPVYPGGSRDSSVSCRPAIRIVGSAWASQTETHQRHLHRVVAVTYGFRRHKADGSRAENPE